MSTRNGTVIVFVFVGFPGGAWQMLTVGIVEIHPASPLLCGA
jgi:hypothetical protein